MNKEILILDDYEIILNIYSKLVSLIGGNPIIFSDSDEAISYLEKKNVENFPLAYFVDMKLLEDLEGSENFYNYLKNKEIDLNNFYFMSGNLSEHDEQVLSRTNAKFFLKGKSEEFVSRIEKILK